MNLFDDAHVSDSSAGMYRIAPIILILSRFAAQGILHQSCYILGCAGHGRWNMRQDAGDDDKHRRANTCCSDCRNVPNYF